MSVIENDMRKNASFVLVARGGIEGIDQLRVKVKLRSYNREQLSLNCTSMSVIFLAFVVPYRQGRIVGCRHVLLRLDAV
jgi:hypothetical protein